MARGPWLLVGNKRLALVMRARRTHGRHPRGGVTILELLVVLLILLMVTAAAIPIVAPALQNRQMRESGRLVSSYFSQARSRAIETGRPVGVVIERFDGQPFAFQLSQVEVPPPYSGDFVGSRMAVDADGNSLRFVGTMDVAWQGLLRYGDLIKLNHREPLYQIRVTNDKPGQPLTTANQARWRVNNLDGSLPSFPASYSDTAPYNGVPFQIFRQPTPSATAPLQLPEAIVVDLACSGVGTNGSFLDADLSFGGTGVMTGTTPSEGPIVTFDPVIMFSPSGRLESVSLRAATWLRRTTDPVYLLLGRRELMFDAARRNQPTDAVAQNLSPVAPDAVAGDANTWPPPPAHFWITIGAQTGKVTVTEVAPNFQDYLTPNQPLASVITSALSDARQFARESQGVGGR